MTWDDEEETTTYLVIINHEEQYSIWPDYKEIPKGWRAVGKTGERTTVKPTLERHRYATARST